MKTIKQRYRHLRRYQTIAQVLIGHGFGEILDQLGVAQYLDLPRRLFRSEPPPAITSLTAPQRVRLAIQELGPTFIKLAQVLSTRPDLIPTPYLNELARMQDKVPPSPWPAIRTRMEAELGAPIEKVFAELEEEPMAAASLAQVHRATLPSGEQVVVKVQRPDIETVIETDLEILMDLAQFLQTRTALSQLYDFPEIAQDFAYSLRAEMDYRSEGRNADRFRENFANEPYVHIPQVYWNYTSERLIVFERINGIKIDDIDSLDAAGLDRHQIALHCARMIVKEVLEDGFFHADPHAGNFAVLTNEAGEPVIGAMDFGLVGYLSPPVRKELIRLFVVAVRLDPERITEQLVRMNVAQKRIDQTGLNRDLDRLLRSYYGRPLKEIRARQLVEEIMPIAFRHQLRLPSELWLLSKTLTMMEGIGIKLDPDFDMFEVADPYAKRFLRPEARTREMGQQTTERSRGLERFIVPVAAPALPPDGSGCGRRIGHWITSARSGAHPEPVGSTGQPVGRQHRHRLAHCRSGAHDGLPRRKLVDSAGRLFCGRSIRAVAAHLHLAFGASVAEPAYRSIVRSGRRAFQAPNVLQIAKHHDKKQRS